MLYATYGQGWVFLAMCAAGALIGLWYDVCRALRRLLAAGPLLSLLADGLFGLGAAALFCLACYAACWGAARPYQLLAAGLGWLLYALGAAPALRAVLRPARALCRRASAALKENRIIKVIFR